MRTTAATAFSTSFDVPAVAAAALQAASRLRGQKANYGFLFASPGVDLQASMAAVREATGVAELIACTTAGEVTEKKLLHGGVSLMLVAGDVTTQSNVALGLKRDPLKAAGVLLDNLPATRRAAAAREHRHLTTVLLTDGLTGTAERLVNAMYDANVHGSTQIVGGAAGDEGAFKETRIGVNRFVASDAATALHVFSVKPWGVGVGHGLEPTTKQMRVTKAHDNVVVEIDGEPAFAVYERHAAARGIHLTRENASRYLIGNEMGIHFFEKVSRARAALSVDEHGALVCAAEVPKGSMISILDGQSAKMIAAARAAAEQAHARLNGAPVAGVLLFDCVCRGMILADAFSSEIEAVRGVFGEVPVAGFLTYGEIARHPRSLDGWHNATAVVVAIPA